MGNSKIRAIAMMLSLLLVGSMSASAGSNRFERTGRHAEQLIGPDGGEISLDGVTLVIPPGALKQRMAITIDTARPTAKKDKHLVRGNLVYEFGPDGLRFLKPALVSIAVTDPVDELPFGLSVFWFNQLQGDWQRLMDSAFDASTRQLIAKISHFSTYAAGTSASEFAEPFGPSRSYFVNNDEVVSPQTGCLRIIRKQFDVPGRAGMNLSLSDYLSPDEDLREPDFNLPELQYLSVEYPIQPPTEEVRGPYTTSRETKVTWNGGLHDVNWVSSVPSGSGRIRMGYIRNSGVKLAVEVTESPAYELYSPVSAVIYTPDGTKYSFPDGRHLSSITDKNGKTKLQYHIDESPDFTFTVTDDLSRTISVGTTHVDGLFTASTLSAGSLSRTFRTATTLNGSTQFTDPAGRTTVYRYDDHRSPNTLSVEYPTGGKTVYTFVHLQASGVGGAGYQRHVVSQVKRYASKNDAAPIATTAYQYTLNASRPYTYFDGYEYLEAPTVYDVKTCLANDGITKTRFEYDAPLRHGASARDDVPSYCVPGPSVVTVWDASIADGSLDLTAFLEKTVNEYDTAGNLTNRTIYRSGNVTLPVSIEEWAYDEWGNVIYHKDPIGHETYSMYLNTNQSQFNANNHGFTNSFYTSNSVPPNVHNALAGRAESRGPGQPNAETYLQYEIVGGVPTGSLKQKKELHRGVWVTTDYISDQYGNVISMREPDGYTTTYTYGPEFRSAYLTKDAKIVTGLWLNASELTAEVSATLSYDPNTGERTGVIDSDGHTTSYKYDVVGRLKEIVLPAVSGVTASRIAFYDDANSTITVSDENGVPLKYYFDGLGRLSKVETIKKDDLGAFSIVTSTKTLTYDALDRLTSETVQADGKWYVTSYMYDALGRLKQTKYPDGSFTRAEYQDNYDADGTTTTLLKQIWDENEQLREFGYDAAERLVWVKEYPIKGDFAPANALKTTYEYDELGKLLKVTDGNIPPRVTQYSYDELGHLRSATYPDLSATINDCRASGDVASRVDQKNQTTNSTYDEIHRLRKITDQSGTTLLQYWFDKDGNRVRAESQGVITSFTYDERNRLRTATRTIGGRSYPLTLDYDNVGNRNSFTGPDNTTRVLSYDERNRITSVGGFTINGVAETQAFEYYDAGPLKKTTYANGILANYAIDKRLRPSTVGFTGDSLLTLTYGYDNAGNVVLYDGVTYQYDGLNRLEKGF